MSMTYRDYFSGSSNTAAVAELARITSHLIDLLFNEDQKDLRVFLFLDDDKQREISTRLALPAGTTFETHLNATMQQLPTSGQPLEILQNMVSATGLWRAGRDLLATPPALPLLLIFSNAARAMGDDGDVAANNYYARLQECLGITTAQKHLLVLRYREWSVELWESYRDWLDAWQGEIGLCTVTFPNPTGSGASDENPNRKYVQMSISQAILRRHDRENLTKMFQIFNLDSSISLPEQIMQAMIEEWQTRGQCSPRLRKMWKKKETHQPIVVGALAHLAQWSPTEEDVSKDWITLGLSAQRNSRTGEVTINLDVLTKQPPRSAKFEVLNSEEAWTELPVFEVEARRLRVSGQASLTVQTKLETIIEGRLSHSAGAATRTRLPRAIVPLLLQPATREYTESSTILLNQPQAILIRTDKNPGILDKVSRLLDEAALPGWHLLTPQERRNIPENWEMIENVHLVRNPSNETLNAHVALGVFDVVSTTFVDTQGGLRLPGRSPRWIVERPPAVVGAFPDDDVTELTLTGAATGHDPSQVLRAEVHDGVAVLDLTTAQLGVGVYDIYTRGSDGKLQPHGHIQLVNSAVPDAFSSANPRPLASQIGENAVKGFLTAEPVFDVQAVPHAKGLSLSRIEERPRLQSKAVPGRLPERQNAPATISEAEVHLAKRNLPECLASGAHYWGIEKGDKERKETYIGRCIYCNSVQGFRGKVRMKSEDCLPSRWRAATASQPKSPAPLAPPRGTFSQLTTVVSSSEDWNLAFEALCYLQQGSYKDLLFVCAQISPGALAATEFWKNLSLLGHIELAFDRYQRPMRWHVPETTISIRDDNHGVVSGRRTPLLKKELETALEKSGYRLEVLPRSGFLDNWQISPSTRDSLAQLKPLYTIDFARIDGLRVERDVGRRLIGSLAPLGVVQSGLEKLKMFGTDRKWWHHPSRTWLPTSDSSRMGSYQTLSSTTAYFFNDSDLRLDDYSLMASYDLVKHLSARAAGEPLCSYNPDSKTLSVPLGADLPRLHARALCACSGQLPVKPDGVRELHYVNVPQVVAEHLYWLLSS
jgi:hypothetical protein